MPRDVQRSKVYAAEQFVRTLFDRAAERGNRSIDFFGAQLTLPPEAKFASVESVQQYVHEVLDFSFTKERWPSADPLTVRARRGVTAAHYEFDGRAAVVAVPDGHATRALRELVVLCGHFTPVDDLGRR